MVQIYFISSKGQRTGQSSNLGHLWWARRMENRYYSLWWKEEPLKKDRSWRNSRRWNLDWQGSKKSLNQLWKEQKQWSLPVYSPESPLQMVGRCVWASIILPEIFTGSSEKGGLKLRCLLLWEAKIICGFSWLMALRSFLRSLSSSIGQWQMLAKNMIIGIKTWGRILIYPTPGSAITSNSLMSPGTFPGSFMLPMAGKNTGRPWEWLWRSL